MHGRWPVTVADQVRAFVAHQDVYCPRCRYNLRGIREPVCPECGTSLDVPMLHGGRGWYRLSLGAPRGLWLGILLNVALALMVISSSMAQGGRLPPLAWAAPAVIGAFLVGVNYGAVFIPRGEHSGELWPEWTGTTLGVLATLQTVGLVLLWA